MAEVKELTGDGVDIVIDGVGEDLFRRSLSVLRFGGRVVAYGYTAGVTSATEADLDLEKTLAAGVPLYELLSDARALMGVHLAAPTAMLRRWWADLLAARGRRDRAAHRPSFRWPTPPRHTGGYTPGRTSGKSCLSPERPA